MLMFFCRLGSGSECGGGGSGGGAPAPQSARVSSNGAGGMAVSRVPSPLHDGNTPVAENWCFTQVMYGICLRALSIEQFIPLNFYYWKGKLGHFHRVVT